MFVCDGGNYKPFGFIDSYVYRWDVVFWDVIDMNLNGLPELVIFHGDAADREIDIWEWNGDGFDWTNREELGQWSRPSCSVLIGPNSFHIEDTNGDGLLELVLEQGFPLESIFDDQLPWREEVRTCGWNGKDYVLIDIEFTAPHYRFQALQDADWAMWFGDFEKALTLYQDVIFSDELDWWSEERSLYEIWLANGIEPGPKPPRDPAEYFHLAAYARFRIMLLHLLRGDETSADLVYRSLQDAFPPDQLGHGFAEMAKEYWDEYQLSGSIKAACGEAVQYALENPDMLDYLRGNGWQAKNYEPLDVCPFTD